MKILFLNLPYKFAISRSSRWPEKTKSGTMYYPYWLCYAAGVCMASGSDDIKQSAGSYVCRILLD